MNTKLGIKGFVKINIIDSLTDEIISSEVQQNMILNPFIYLLKTIGAKNVEGSGFVDDIYRIEKVGFGTSAAANPKNSDADPYRPITLANSLIKDVIQVPGINGLRCSISQGVLEAISMDHYFDLAAGEFNGKTIRELGLFIDKQNGTPEQRCVARVVRAPIVKTAEIRIEGYWWWEFNFSEG